MKLLEARALSVRMNRRYLLHPLDMTLKPGEWKGILGPNGAGKSTLLKAIVGLMPREGKLFWRQQDVSRQPIRFRREIGVLFHEPLVYAPLTAEENLFFYARLYGVEQVKRKVAEQLEAVGLAPFARERVGHFSKGMTQRLALARAMLHEPLLLLLDEPLSSVDAAGEADMIELFREVKDRGVAGLWVTHRWERAWPLVDEMVELDRGRIVRETVTNTAQRKTWRPKHAPSLMQL